MKLTNYGADHPFSVVRGRVAGYAAVGTADLATVSLTVINATISANTDNWNPTGLSTASAIRATLTAAWNLTGIVAPSDDRLMILDNIGGGTLTLKHDVTSTPANRFLCVGDVDMTLPVDGWTWLQYDFTSSRWRVLGTGSGSIPAGTYELAIEGGQDVIKAHGAMGATETFDPTDGNVHTGTLDANCVFTLNAPTGSGASTLEFWLTQDGTGGWTITWPGSVTWDGGTPSPSLTAGVTVRYILETVDGGTNWIGNLVGTGGATGAAGGDLSGTYPNPTVAKINTTTLGTLTGATAGQALAWSGSAWVPATVGADTSAWEHAHVENVVFSGDGSTTVWTLPVAAVDATSIQVFVTASRSIAWVLSGTMFDTLTFDSAPANAANNIVIDIVTPIV
jgi:hypothetical protein